ncbi:GAF domain-containing protein [Methanobacterium sp. ACI-7]|uniref:GAF domain-containing protein n=1 Tax=unclassified Methanobacterium TaxID=2627676 RepID=UPI0039C163B9
MEELSNTERLIVSYIKSHPPEECMLDKITRGTGRSRATVLKYLDILHAKGILSYKFVGRSKLWYLSQDKGIAGDIIVESKETLEDSDELVSSVSKLHCLISEQIMLKELIDKADTIIFTIDTQMNIITTNSTFETFFRDSYNLKDILDNKQQQLIENAVQSLKSKNSLSIEIDLMEKNGVFRPYHISMQPIIDKKNNIIGMSFIGKEISSSKRTKRDLETLLSIFQVADSSENEENVINEIKDIINTFIPYKYFDIFLKDGKRFYSAYKTYGISSITDNNIPDYISAFIEKSMDSMETITTKAGDYSLEAIKSNLNDNSLSMAISIPLIEEEKARGAILLLTTRDSVSSVSVENVEIAADELSSYLKIQRLTHEREEFANTLIAMNKVSSVINSSEVEEEMLERAVSAVINSLGFDMGCIYLSDEDEELSLRVQKNLPESLKNMCIEGRFKDLFTKTLEKENIFYITPEVEEYEFLEPAIKSNGIKTLLILPIKNGEDIIGLLNMGSNQIKAYNEISLENLSSIGLQLGVALERSRLAIKLKNTEI